MSENSNYNEFPLQMAVLVGWRTVDGNNASVNFIVVDQHLSRVMPDDSRLLQLCLTKTFIELVLHFLVMHNEVSVMVTLKAPELDSLSSAEIVDVPRLALQISLLPEEKGGEGVQETAL